MSLNIVTGKATDQQTTTALRLLCTVLLDGNSAPLRLALLAAGIGSDISGDFATAQLQPVFSIKAGGADPQNKDKFISTVFAFEDLEERNSKNIIIFNNTEKNK